MTTCKPCIGLIPKWRKINLLTHPGLFTEIAVATDFNPGSAPSYHLPLAMTLACLNQGMTPQESLKGATTVAARAVSSHDRCGSLLPGYQADLAIIDSPSLNHWLYHFQANACVAVMKRGEWIQDG